MILGMSIAVLSGLVLIPVFVLALEIMLSLVPQKRGLKESEILVARPRIAVLIPAHNEEAVISGTLARVQTQLKKTDILLVVADNCEDKTADIASKSGAIVLVRSDPVKRGKGFALDYGVDHLSQISPDIVIIVDADCLIGPGLIEQISELAISENRPVQALYLMENCDPSPALSKRLAEFAWRVKNFARPLGLKIMGMPCQLMGSGMAIPFKLLNGVKLGSSNIVEDMQLGIDLTVAGFPPVFYPEVTVTSQFPESTQAAESQRKRWEHGHISTILSKVPGLFTKSIMNRDVRLFLLALDLMVPPLTLLAVFVSITFVASGLALLTGVVEVAFYLSTITLLLFICSVLVAWLGYGRNLLSLREIMILPVKMIMKLPLYLQFIVNRQKKWIRTDRE